MNVSEFDNQPLVFQNMLQLDCTIEDVKLLAENLKLGLKVPGKGTQYVLGGVEVKLKKPSFVSFTLTQFAEKDRSTVIDKLDYKLGLRKALAAMGYLKQPFDYTQYAFHVVMDEARSKVFLVIQKEHEDIRNIELLAEKDREEKKSLLLTKKSKIETDRLNKRISEREKAKRLNLVEQEAEAA